MNEIERPCKGAGLGLRSEFISTLRACSSSPVNFLELVLENWLEAGGKRKDQLIFFTAHYPVVCHGLSLSIGSSMPLNMAFLQSVKRFLMQYRVIHYSEHLSYCSDRQGQLYDLFPIPFTQEAVHYVADRIKTVQDVLERQVAFENISYYLPLAKELTEIEFINAVLDESDCQLLLDVNNVYVNSVNHQYDPFEFIESLPGKRIAYLHLAGHQKESEHLLIDTHGDQVIDPVWQLLKHTYKVFGVIPTVLERDNNIPSLDDLLKELDHIRTIQAD